MVLDTCHDLGCAIATTSDDSVWSPPFPAESRIWQGPGQGPARQRYDSLVQGVSQQPPYRRQSGSGEEQINGWSSVVEGLTKRRPGKFLFRLTTSQVPDFYTERFIVTDDERYRIVVLPFRNLFFMAIYRGAVRQEVAAHGPGILPPSNTLPYPDGDPQGWIIGNFDSYLASSDFLNGFVVENAGPFGLLLNRSIVTGMGKETAADRPPEALLFCQAVNFNVEYKLIIDGIEVSSYTTPAIDSGETISTTAVITELLAGWGQDGFTVEQNKFTAWLRRADGGEFTVELDDGNANTLARAIKDKVSSVQVLPELAPEGFQITVDSNPSTPIDDYFLVFDADDGQYSEGIWQEGPEPGSLISLDETTMPHVLYRSAPGAFFFGPADGSTQEAQLAGDLRTYEFPEWGKRTAGSEPDQPPFIDRQIRDMKIVRQRLAFAAGSTVSLSEADDIFNFWPDTATSTLETDTFDLVATSQTSTALNWLLAVDEGLLAFSDDSQFSIRPIGQADVFSARTVQVTRLSNIDMNERIRPLLVGPNAMFATEEYGFTHFREFQYFDSSSSRIGINLGGAQNTNDSTPRYITGRASHWQVGQNLDFSAVMGPGEPNTVWIYKYLWNIGQGGAQKLQQSWSKWQFSQQVVNLLVDENILDVYLLGPEGVEVLTITPEELQSDVTEVYLDRAIDYPECLSTATPTDDVVASYDAKENKTTFSLPYQAVAPTVAVIREGPGRGSLIGEIDSGNVMVCEATGDFRGSSIRFGERYQFRFDFSTAYPMVQGQNQQMIGETSGRLQLHYWQMFHFNTGFYRVRVRRENRGDTVLAYRARKPGVSENRLSTEQKLTDTGAFRVPVHARNTDCSVTVESDNWLPVTITSCEWEGTYSNRSR